MIGSRCRISSKATFRSPEKIHLGNNVVIEDGALIDATYGEGIFIEDEAQIQRNACLISSGLTFDTGFIKIGHNARIGIFNLIAGHAGVTIGSCALLGPYVSVNGYAHNFDQRDVPIIEQGGVAVPIDIGEDVYLGTRATVLKGKIGKGAVVAAGSLVTGYVEPFALMRGTPATFVKYRDE